MNSVRIDKWLWAARFFRTRALAKQALEKGQVKIQGVKARPSRDVQVGMLLEVRQGRVVKRVEVMQLSEQRGPASQAAELYRETPESVRAREQEAAMRRAHRAGLELPGGRPDKRQRRQLSALKRGSPGRGMDNS